jgi:hypothetical protein
MNTQFKITLVDFQLDAQNSYLFLFIYVHTHTYNTYIKVLQMKFYHYQFSPVSNAANCNTVILDNSLFTV